MPVLSANRAAHILARGGAGAVLGVSRARAIVGTAGTGAVLARAGLRALVARGGGIGPVGPASVFVGGAQGRLDFVETSPGSGIYDMQVTVL